MLFFSLTVNFRNFNTTEVHFIGDHLSQSIDKILFNPKITRSACDIQKLHKSHFINLSKFILFNFFKNFFIEKCITWCYGLVMLRLMTKHFSKWATRQKIPLKELNKALTQLQAGNFEANLGGNIYKKRIRFQGKGKSGSGRTIICYKVDDRAIFVHGFAKNEKSNLSKKELIAFKELSKILLKLSQKDIALAIENGDLIEVES